MGVCRRCRAGASRPGGGSAVLVGATLSGDATALARVELQPLGGTLESARAFAPDGKQIPLSARNGRLLPQTRLKPGERVSVEVVVRRPGWLAWALGRTRRERLTVRTPVARLRERWLTVPAGSALRVAFDRPVSAIAYGPGAHPARRELQALAARSCSDTGRPRVRSRSRPPRVPGSDSATRSRVSWFPPARTPVLISSPPAGARITPLTPIRLTFSEPVADLLGSARPTLTPSTTGRWRSPDTHTLLLLPPGYGAPLGTTLSIRLPDPVTLVPRSARSVRTTRQLAWTVPPVSTLRLQQLWPNRLSPPRLDPRDGGRAHAPVPNWKLRSRRRPAASDGATPTTRSNCNGSGVPAGQTRSPAAP